MGDGQETCAADTAYAPHECDQGQGLFRCAIAPVGQRGTCRGSIYCAWEMKIVLVFRVRVFIVHELIRQGPQALAQLICIPISKNSFARLVGSKN